MNQFLEYCIQHWIRPFLFSQFKDQTHLPSIEVRFVVQSYIYIFLFAPFKAVVGQESKKDRNEKGEI